jgi:hypothetical protein
VKGLLAIDFKRTPQSAAIHSLERAYSAAGPTPKSFDIDPFSAESKPSAASPRLSSSRIAAARLGIRREKRQSSSNFNSCGVSMIWSRSPLLRSPMPLPQVRAPTALTYEVHNEFLTIFTH